MLERIILGLSVLAGLAALRGPRISAAGIAKLLGMGLCLLAAGCAHRGGPLLGDYAGSYCVYPENTAPTTMVLTQHGTRIDFELALDPEIVRGSGSVSDHTMRLSAKFSGGRLALTLYFAADRTQFSGRYEIEGPKPRTGTLRGHRGECVLPLPDIRAFKRSDRFVVAPDELGTRVLGVAPMPGCCSCCYHNGAHVVFAPAASRDAVPILAPVDGIVTLVDPCFRYGDDEPLDQYKIHLAYAKKDGRVFELEFAIEPMAGVRCSDGDPDYFQPYIYVTPGQRVHRGDELGAMVRIPGFQGHIHLNSKYRGRFLCPDIFTADVIDRIDDYYGPPRRCGRPDGTIPETCNGTPFSEIACGTICYRPRTGESHDDY